MNYNKYEEEEIINMLKDTANLYKNILIGNKTELLTNEVEFFKWLKGNYPNHFTSIDKIKEILSKEGWIRNFQGKQYEWNSVNQMRGELKNIFSEFDLGLNPTQKGIDITEKNIFTGNEINTYQNKAYYGKNIPNLKNTEKNTIVITNKENIANIEKKGYKTKEYLNAEEGLKIRNDQVEKINSGEINIEYNLKNISMTMTKAALIGGAIGIGVETVCSYKKWKKGEITTDEYLKEIIISGGQSSLNATGTTGLMIPVSTKIVAKGMSKYINFPVAIAISFGLDKVIAPIFKRGDYKETLAEAKYYQNLNNLYKDLAKYVTISDKAFKDFVYEMIKQNEIYNDLEEKNLELKKSHKKINEDLEKLYNSI